MLFQHLLQVNREKLGSICSADIIGQKVQRRDQGDGAFPVLSGLLAFVCLMDHSATFRPHFVRFLHQKAYD